MEKYHLISLICGMGKKKKKRLMGNRLVLPDMGGRRWGNWVKGYKLSVISYGDVIYSMMIIVKIVLRFKNF